MSGFQTLNPASPGGYTWLQAGVLVPLSWIKTILVRTCRALEAPGTDKISWTCEGKKTIKTWGIRYFLGNHHHHHHPRHHHHHHISYHIISYNLLLHLLLDVNRCIFSACRLCKAKVPSEGATTHLEAEQGPSDLSRGKSYQDVEGILEYLIYRIYAHSRAEIFGYLHLSPLFLPSTWSANSVSCWRTQLIAVGRLDHLIIRLGQHPGAHAVHVKVAASYHYGFSSLSKF